MRGLALRELRTSQWCRVIGQECMAGLLNGRVVVATTQAFFSSLGIATLLVEMP